MKRKIWIISEFYYPDENATGYLITKVAESLTETNEVRVLCRWQAICKKENEPTSFVHKDVIVDRVHSSTYNKDIFLLRLINIATFSSLIFIQLIRNLSYGDKALVVTNPPSLPLVVAIACRLSGAKYNILVHDVYPEVMVAAGILNERNPVVFVMRWITRKLLVNANHIIVLGRDMSDLLTTRYHDAIDKIVIIPNWGDINAIIPEDRSKNSILRELDLERKFIVQYIGNIGRTHNIELLVECAEKLKQRNDIKFLFIGDGAKKNWLTVSVIKRNLNNVVIKSFYSREKQCDVHNACDIAVISFIPGMAGISVPSRMYNIMAAGKPILAITDRESELAMVVGEEKTGWVITSYRSQDIIDVILSMKENKSELHEMGLRARKVAEEKYSYDRIIRLYRNLFQ
jgi:glycosyltransferase involved in cell wall biosynthesis